MVKEALFRSGANENREEKKEASRRQCLSNVISLLLTARNFSSRHLEKQHPLYTEQQAGLIDNTGSKEQETVPSVKTPWVWMSTGNSYRACGAN